MAKAFFEKLPKEPTLFVHGAAATPNRLLELLCEEADRFDKITLIHLHTEGKPSFLGHRNQHKFFVKSLFVGKNLRPLFDQDRFDYIPCFLSEIPSLFRSHSLHLDGALVHVSPADDSGFCSLGTSVDVAKAALEVAPLVYAQINAKMPRTHGDSFFKKSQLSNFIEIDEPLPSSAAREPNEAEVRIGQHIAELVEDGSTLQLGIGAVPDAVLAKLAGHRNLGIHSEMFTDRVIDLIESGVINNSQKKVHPGRSIATFVNGQERLFKYIHDNPSVALFEASYVNSPLVIMRNPKVVAINSAVEIDLTGQVCADSVGHRIISGVGGQMDFIRAASLSPGGKPILAFTSRTTKGQSRITAELKPGAGVVTTRSHVHYVVTEYGVANLFGKSLQQRAQALIGLAHPEDREDLKRKNFKLLH